MACNCTTSKKYKVKKGANLTVADIIVTDVNSNPPSVRKKTIDGLFSNDVHKISKVKACELKNTLDDINKKISFAKTGTGLQEYKNYRKLACEEIDKVVSPDQECADKHFGGDLDKLENKRKECKSKNQKFSCRSGKCYTPSQNNNQPEPEVVVLQGCMDPEAVNYVEGATTPTQCEYEIEIDLLNEYIFCNTSKGCLDSNQKNTLKRGTNTVSIRPTGGRSPYEYVKEITASIYDVISEYTNQLYPIDGIGFYSEEKNNYLQDFAKALSVMLIKNKTQLEDYDSFPYNYVSIYGGGMRVPYATARLGINSDWGDNIKNVVISAKLFNAKSNFTKLLQVASNNNLSFDLDFLENNFNKDVNWLNNNIQGNGYIVSNSGAINLLEHKEGLGKVLNEHRKPTGLVNILK